MKNLTKNSRIILALTVLFCAAALLLAASSNLPLPGLWPRQTSLQTPVSLTVVPLGTINKPIQITRTGSLESAASVPINAAFSGRLSEIYVTEGQAIKAGQPLLKLQPSANVTATQQAAVPSQQLQANYDNALKEYNRYQKLYEIGAIPRRQMESITAKLQEAQERLADSGTQSSSGSISGPTTITAPIDGIVTGLATAPDKEVRAGQLLLSLGSGQEIGAVVHLDQNDLYLVQLGTPVTIEVSQQTIIGQVSRIYPQVEANQNPIFIAHIKLANPDRLLKAGMSATIHINTGQAAIVPAVPTASILQDGQGQTYIYLAVNDKAVLQQISVGKTIGDFTEITSNLPEESLIITSSLNALRDGDTITVIQ